MNWTYDEILVEKQTSGNRLGKGQKEFFISFQT